MLTKQNKHVINLNKIKKTRIIKQFKRNAKDELTK